MNLTPEQYVLRLIGIAEKKYKLMKDIDAFTKRQSEAIHSEEMETLEQLVGDKQLRIDDINKLDAEFDVYFKRFKSELKVKSLDELKGARIQGTEALQKIIDSIHRLTQEISRLEADNQTKAQGLLNQYGDEIRRMNMGKKANNAYAPPPAKSPSYYIDKKK